MIVYPLDTIAIQNQTSTTRPLFPSSQTFLKSFRGLYRGLGVSIMITTPAVALYLCSYRQAKESLMPYLGEKTPNYILSGCIAETMSSFMWTPLEVLKARLQISSSSSSGSLMVQVRELYRAEGVRGFYRGYLMGLAVYMPYNAIWWSSYENSKSFTQGLGVEKPAYQAAIGSALATSLSTSLSHPLDLLKTRYQVSTSESISALIAAQSSPVPSSSRTSGLQAHGSGNRSSDQMGIKYVLRNVLRESGWRGLYAGIGPRLFCSIPSSVISMAVFEYLRPDDNTKGAAGDGNGGGGGGNVVGMVSGRRIRLADGTDIQSDNGQLNRVAD